MLAVVSALAVAAFQYWNTVQRRSANVADAAVVTQTPWGPLGPADRNMLAKVRQAGLWEMPTGQRAEQQGSSARVRQVGGMIASEHTELDQRVRDTAAQLGVILPSQPSAQQQGWIAEIASKSGSDFDRTFVQRLRAAHGVVLPVIAQVRAGTRNELIRQFATTAAEFVTRHMGYLESTGLVDFDALPLPPAPTNAAPAPAPAPAYAPLPAPAYAPLPAPAPPAAPAPPVASAPAAVPAPAAPTAVPPPAPPAGTSLASGAAPTRRTEAVSQVAKTTAVVGGVNVMIAALVYIAGLLAVVGLLTLAGSSSLRARRARRAQRAAARTRPPQRPLTAQRVVSARPRHAAQRW
jgi:predicted outer membrane protein